MRIFLLLIASCLFFTAPASSGTVLPHDAKHDQFSAAQQVINHLQSDELNVVPTAHIMHVGQNLKNDAPQRPYAFGKYIHVSFDDDSNDPFIDRVLFVRPYHFPIPIGLKLLFPKHYFW